MKTRLLLIIVLSFSILLVHSQSRFAAVFTDNMVLQQNAEVKIWGFSKPSEKISLRVSWVRTSLDICSGPDGKWSVALKTPKADATPHFMILSTPGQQSVEINNILFGEVWLCSGQSNMEMVLQNMPEWNLFIENAAEEIAAANFPAIRMLTVGRKESFEGQDDIASYGWKVCTPVNVKWFSAVAYFFGKKLYEKLKVPVGLVVSSYGGSPVQSWIPERVIAASPIYQHEKESREAEIEASRQTEAEYIEAMNSWIAKSESRVSAKPKDKTGLNLPVNLENSSVGNQLGEVAFTREIFLTDKDKDEDLHISLGRMDDKGRVFFNGEQVWSEVRDSRSYADIRFTVPAGKIREEKNILEARVLNVLWGGGLTGPADSMYYTRGESEERISLTGEWNYRKIFDLLDVSPMPREGKPRFLTSSSLFNGMIYPLLDMTFRGCIWYQGEGNVGDSRYAEMFSDMIKAWREEFKQQMPFYFVQIAPFSYGDPRGDKSVLLRNQQSDVAKTVPYARMAVTIDLGEPENIHPARKKQVGDRLAQLALNDTYGKNIKCGYPEVKTIIRKGKRVILNMKNVYEGLRLEGEKTEMEVSENGQDYVQAKTKIAGNIIEITSPGNIIPRYIRYCWYNISEGNIFNSEGLPLAPFKMAISGK